MMGNKEDRIFKIALALLTVVFCIWLCYALRVLIIDLLLAITLASAIAPFAKWGEDKHIPRAITVLTTYGIVAAFYTTVAIWLANPIVEQAQLFSEHLPGYLDWITNAYKQLLSLAGDSVNISSTHSLDVRALALNLIKQTFDVTAGFFGLILNSVLVLFLAAYFVIEADHILGSLLLWIPPENRERARALIHPLSQRMGGYVRGQILVSTAIASFLAAGLTLLQVNYGLVLGLLAGVLNLLPFIGSLLTAILAILVSLNQSFVLALLTALLFLVEQTLESNFIVPHLLGKQVELHPLLVLFAILIGATLAGALGALVAVPAASAGLFLAQEFYLKPLNVGLKENSSELQG